ncbi:hypothetical protein MKQ68_05150 [Chitinophaga horti]|uniref:DUF6850 domain-containing protein n=1 Tax=Chitinophaga horti TaxID=2920382 RepID=A0ABY6J482_9BACT|nr:DUF6850 family outer membrane beta-barrel protein [Chitinophaga horti]UYQ94476.1 hypothetical protein MKQ68_05150 [Chitinophaga horti]
MKKLYITVALAAACQATAAQDAGNTPASLEWRRQNSLWEQSGNPAGLKLDAPIRYSHVNAGYESYNGDFRRPQEGASGNRQFVQTEGALYADSFYLSGKFSYTRDAVKDAKFNASIIDPFRGMPFIVADLNASDWSIQRYDLQFNATTRAYGRWSFGLGAQYQASSGAKQRDIRTENYFYSIRVTPGVVYALSDRQHIGFNLDYSNTKEEGSMSNVNVYVDQTYYELYGLGTAVSLLGGGRTNNYEGDAWGGSLQYAYRGYIGVFVNAGYKIEAEDLHVSFTIPRDGATILRKSWNAGVTLTNETPGLLHTLALQYRQRDMDGIQYTTERIPTAGWKSLAKYVRSTFASKQATAMYRIGAKRGREYKWMADISGAYTKLDDVYLLPYSFKKTENLNGEIGGKMNFVLPGNKDARLLVGLSIGYNRNFSAAYEYNGAHPDYPTVTELETNDYRYMASDYVKAELPVTWSTRLKESGKQTLFLKAYGRYVKTGSYDFNDRYTIGGSVGVNF